LPAHGILDDHKVTWQVNAYGESRGTADHANISFQKAILNRLPIIPFQPCMMEGNTRSQSAWSDELGRPNLMQETYSSNPDLKQQESLLVLANSGLVWPLWPMIEQASSQLLP